MIICDEPVSALDVSVQAQILNLLEEMKRKYGLTLVFIAHDLAVVKNVSDRVAVMYLGKLCEFANPDELYAAPAHPYTAALLSAIPEPDPDALVQAREGVGGEIPSPVSPPSGCRFRTRCPSAEERCATEEPQMREVRPDHFVACHFPLGDITVREHVAAAAAPPPVTAPPVAPPAPLVVPPVVPPVTVPPIPAPEPPATPVSAAGATETWIASSPVSPGAPDVVAPPPAAPEPPTVSPADSWLAAEITPVAPAEPPRPAVDWTPDEPSPAPSATPPLTPPPTPPPTPPASAPPPPAPVADDLAPPEPEPATIPDVTSLDTLLPDRTKGGSIDPGK